MISIRFACLTLLAIAATARAGGLERGTPDIKSAGPLAFGPDGVLFVGDPIAGAVFAIDTGDTTFKPFPGVYYFENFSARVDSLLPNNAHMFRFNDMAINPASGKAYFSLDLKQVPGSKPVIARLGPEGMVDLVPLQDISFAKVSMPDPAPRDPRRMGPKFSGLGVTGLAFVDGQLYVAGLSGKQFLSRITALPYPFPDVVSEGTIIEIFQAAAGEYNKTLPIYTFSACKLKGEPYFLAAYSQTPLVKIPLSALKPGTEFRAATVADLGNRNNPFDMLVYQNTDTGKDFVVVANTRQDLMKISLDWLADASPIETRLVGPAGLPYERVDKWKGVNFLEPIDGRHALVASYNTHAGTDGHGGYILFVIPMP